MFFISSRRVLTEKRSPRLIRGLFTGFFPYEASSRLPFFIRLFSSAPRRNLRTDFITELCEFFPLTDAVTHHVFAPTNVFFYVPYRTLRFSPFAARIPGFSFRHELPLDWTFASLPTSFPPPPCSPPPTPPSSFFSQCIPEAES